MKRLVLPEDVPYRVGRRISEEAQVYQAADLHNGSACVIKFAAPKPSLVRQSPLAWKRRLEAEAEKLARWSGRRNVVCLLDAQMTGRRPFLVLKQLGLPLEGLLPPDGLGLRESAKVLRDMAAAVTDIHALGDTILVVKPENVLSTTNGGGPWKLSDPGDEGFQTAEYSPDHLRGWRGGRTFITILCGAIDTDLALSQRILVLDPGAVENVSFTRYLLARSGGIKCRHNRTRIYGNNNRRWRSIRL